MLFYLAIILWKLISKKFSHYESDVGKSIMIGVGSGLLSFFTIKYSSAKVGFWTKFVYDKKSVLRFIYAVITTVIFAIGNHMLFDWLNIARK